MNLAAKSTLSLCAMSLLLAQVTPAMAARSSVGAIAGEQKLFKGLTTHKNEAGDVAFSPILLEMAKIIGRSGLPAGFFLQTEGNFADEPSIDLRSLLLFQAGLIKTPVRIMAARKPAARENLPTLSVQPVRPDGPSLLLSKQPTDLPNLASTPLPRDPQSSQVVSPRTNVGTPEKISIPAAQAGERIAAAPMISFDLSRLQADLNINEPADDEKARLQADLPRLALSLPKTSSLPFTTRNLFRLWTFRPDGSALNKALASDSGITYGGSFVVASTGAIKSITGRHFTMGKGKLLVNNQAGELIIKTPDANISIEPEATATIEVVENGNGGSATRIFALEGPNGHSVSVSEKATTDAKQSEPIALKAGEALLLGSTELLETGTPITQKVRLNDHATRANFSVDKFVERELMLKSEMLDKTSERYAAVHSLRKRLQPTP